MPVRLLGKSIYGFGVYDWHRTVLTCFRRIVEFMPGLCWDCNGIESLHGYNKNGKGGLMYFSLTISSKNSLEGQIRKKSSS